MSGSVRRRSIPADFSSSNLNAGFLQRPVGQGADGRRDRIQAENLAQEKMAQGASAVLVVLVKDLGLEFGHVDLRGHSVLHALH